MWRKIKQGKGRRSEPLLYHFSISPADVWGKTVQAEGTARAKALGGKRS